MSAQSSQAEQIAENADTDRDVPQPAIHVEHSSFRFTIFLRPA